jgi:hypothetical protein
MSILKRMFQLLFCRPRTLAEVRDQQKDWEGKLAVSGIILTTAATKISPKR